MGLNLALIATIFVTRGRWAAWAFDQRLPRASSVLGAAWLTPDKRRLVGYSPGFIYLADLRAARILLQQGCTGQPCLSPDGSMLAVRLENDVGLVSTEDGSTYATLRGHSDYVLALALSGDGKRVITGALDATARVWDSADGKLLTTHHGHAAAVRPVYLSENGGLALSASDDGKLHLWRPAASDQPVEIDVRLDRGEWAALGGEGHIAVVWERELKRCGFFDTRDGRALVRFKGVRAVVMSADSQILAVATDDELSAVTIGGDGVVLRGKARGRFGHLSLSADGRKLLAFGLPGRCLKLWDLRDGTLLATLAANNLEGSLLAAQLAPDGTRAMVLVESDSSLRVVDTSTGGTLWQTTPVWELLVLDDDHVLVNRLSLLRRVRPEWWWGVFWLPHFWLIAALGVGVFLSGWRDLRRMRRREREAAWRDLPNPSGTNTFIVP
ncbi:MAG: WD40 repeat domain-containing protein [Planctomycetota bacterium]|jgi:WD40 repeat protein